MVDRRKGMREPVPLSSYCSFVRLYRGILLGTLFTILLPSTLCLHTAYSGKGLVSGRSEGSRRSCPPCAFLVHVSRQHPSLYQQVDKFGKSKGDDLHLCTANVDGMRGGQFARGLTPILPHAHSTGPRALCMKHYSSKAVKQLATSEIERVSHRIKCIVPVVILLVFI